MSDVPALSQPHVRRELQTHLSELAAADPRPTWRAEQGSGLASGIDQVFHFFFDDHDFGDDAIGATLRRKAEVHQIAAVKLALERVLAAVGDADDDAFLDHPLWTAVREAAGAAKTQMA